jgi:hypothetical protein
VADTARDRSCSRAALASVTNRSSVVGDRSFRGRARHHPIGSRSRATSGPEPS